MTTETPSETDARAGLSGGALTAIFVAIVGVGLLYAWLQGGPAVAEVGQPAPPLAVESFSGETFDLDQHFASGGGPILLNLWASWCEPCKREFPALSDYAETNPEITVVGVAVQDRLEPAREFAQEMQPSFLVGLDTDGAVRDAYPSFGLPATFLIDAEGTVTEIVLAELTPERLAEFDFGT
jgi:cytochrome c biogenesis protein CcmG, thiol:disulfide interchange protein DsbE